IPSGEVVTRGEWISKLVETMGIKEKQELEIDDLEYGFDDIEDSQYKEDIVYAKIFNIIENIEGAFKPNEPATREFAAVTAVKALDFRPTKDIVCDDASEITYLKEIEIAVSMKIINLEKNKFHPLRSITEAESKYVIEGVVGILKSTEVDEDYDSVIEYKDGVIKFEDNTVYEVNGSTVTFDLNDKTKNLKNDDIFILPGEKPYKVVSVKVEGKKVIVLTSEPKMEEALNYIDAQGLGTIDMSKFVPAEGVEITQEDTPETFDINGEGSIGGVGKVKLSVEKELESGITLATNVDFSLPKVSYKADVDLGFASVDVNNVYLKFLSETVVTSEISMGADGQVGGGCDGLIELGKVPVVGIPGVTIYAQIGLAYNVEGKISIVFTEEGELGIQVLDNNLRGINAIKSNLDLPEMEVTGELGPKITGLLEICQLWDLIDFSASLGGAVTATATVRDTGMICIDGNIYVFAKLSALDIGIIGEWLNLGCEWDIWDSENSPVKFNLHLEDFNFTPECTYGAGSIKGTVAEAGNRTSFIKDSLIRVYDKSNNKLITKVKSDVNGQYKVNLKDGSYRLKISKEGYIPFECTETITNSEVKYVETYLMVGQGEDGEEGIAGGKITNALTGEVVPDVSIKVRQGWNNVTGN
ncbi:MAG: carboxypeptidase-like regulatory domain-containing protein, partial [Clostridium sp.]